MKKPNKINKEIISRYKLIRAIHTCCFTRMDLRVEDFAKEYFYIVGDIFEGRLIDESNLRTIDMTRVREFLAEEG
ncbi:MAG: hypothetical protein DRP42_07645 [Tenericutes bacterium]|nr:MAG: hypothetical protein DRP42_07645 [Mycoplasmatota bacterium]